MDGKRLCMGNDSTSKDNVFKIKLVADDKPDLLYLFYQQGQDKLVTGRGGDEV